ncbi:unnamed protein product [Cuscuta campestris]|uniref:Uncharacterized protein n=1 Tax=Cuscuta campestris TaxID=132261 RepID=A0A484KLE4_9ASTE|nr:unnamed protein product [Cuscuta campestris]
MSGGSCGNSESERDEGFAFLAMSAHPSALITVLREIFKHSSMKEVMQLHGGIEARDDFPKIFRKKEPSASFVFEELQGQGVKEEQLLSSISSELFAQDIALATLKVNLTEESSSENTGEEEILAQRLFQPAFDEYFESVFKAKRVKWSPAIDEEKMKEAFFSRAAGLYSGYMYNQRTDGRLKKKTVEVSTLESLKEGWSGPEFQETSKRKKRNRRKGKQDGPALGTYTGGTIPFSENYNRLKWNPSALNLLPRQKEQVKAQENEKIDDMFERFSKIINDLHALKKTYTDKELVRKILRSLTSEWRSKADAIQESIDITNVTIDGLRGGQRKRSRTGKNVASSLAPPPPPTHKYLDVSFLWFNDRVEAARFSEKFEHREILPPRFSTARFIHGSIHREARVILERGNFLDLLYIKKAHYQPFLVRAFYSNLKKDEDGALISNVNGVDIYLNEEKNSNSHRASSEWRGSQPIRRRRRGTKFNHTALSQEDTKTLHTIIHNANIYWCKFEMTHMFSATSGNQPLPYALLVMAILDEFHVKMDVGPKQKGTKHWEIDESSFHPGTDESPFPWADRVVGLTVRAARLAAWPVEWGCLNGQQVGAAGLVRRVVDCSSRGSGPEDRFLGLDSAQAYSASTLSV